MSQYDELDRLILEAISQKKSPLYSKAVQTEAARLAELTARDDFRVTDGRLQALRRRGVIKHVTKAKAAGDRGWRLVPTEAAA